MTFSDKSYNLRVEVDTKNCNLSLAEADILDHSLHILDESVRRFPRSDLYVTILRHARRRDHRVKTSLVLPGRTLFTGDHDDHPMPAVERCVRKLVHKVDAYKHSLSRVSEVAKHRKGTHQEIIPTELPDAELLEHAVADGDYVRFRSAMRAYDDPLRQRVGRWIQRYPALEARIGGDIQIDDAIEEVLLNAFARFRDRPLSLPLSEWLESLINPSVRLLLMHPEDEMENISFARTIEDTENG
jgi:ribosome-associated translation inhibitor RaiA